MNYKKAKVHVGLIHIGKKEKSGIKILEKLGQHEFTVIEFLINDSDDTVSGIEAVDVIVVNIGLTKFLYEDFLLSLCELDKKIIINEAALTNHLSGVKVLSWERHLLHKIDSSFSLLPSIFKQANYDDKQVNLEALGINQVWVLIASIGGPEAIKEFLSEFDGSEGLLFIVVQHIDKEPQDTFIKQLDKNSQYKVKLLTSGMKIKAHDCYIYPTDEYVKIDLKGTITIEERTDSFPFTPCIDECCDRLLKNFKGLNMAVFSGMSTDGIKAARQINKRGNKVITQAESSCVLSTIISGVKNQIDVNFSGIPSEMAKYIMRNL